MKINKSSIFYVVKYLCLFAVFVCSFGAGQVFADTTQANNIADIANIVVSSFASVGRLMIATSYISGIGFSIAAIFKLKQHRDNPTQVPVGAPIALLAVGVILIFLPGVVAPIGETLFGSSDLNSMSGGFTGHGAYNLPGGNTSL